MPRLQRLSHNSVPAEAFAASLLIDSILHRVRIVELSVNTRHLVIAVSAVGHSSSVADGLASLVAIGRKHHNESEAAVDGVTKHIFVDLLMHHFAVVGPVRERRPSLVAEPEKSIEASQRLTENI